ncbi:MAG: Lrp/AsnC family transcriptional regulator [Alphaproteobacteria bacterium]|jgi:Lrp/AsnC family leucine-responsive transcriptional regulator|nr:Lrp/AsnC family transcriptional regulator [Alphaproteobacteria bacterium]
MAETTILDEADRRILRALQADGRTPVTALAEEVGLSATPCIRRIRRMEEAGIIRGYRADVDPRRVGLAVQAFVQVSLSSHAEKQVAAFHRALEACPEVVAAYAMSGAMDYLLHILARDLDAYGAFTMHTLLRLPGVKETRSAFVLGVPKPPAGVPA